MSQKQHLILFYKGDISALTLFCQYPEANICFPPLPPHSNMVDEEHKQAIPISLFPDQLVHKAQQSLQLDEDMLIAEPGFYEQVETPEGIVPVYLARFNVLDPPHQALADQNCTLQPLTSLMGGMPAEMELLRQAYTLLMEG